MSKKVISILLSAAMLVAMFCVGFGALTASADDTVTYYFLAPDNYFKTEAGAANTDVGYYWWAPSENAKWPGEKATPAPEVHPNAFKITAPNNDVVANLVFNAFVDAGSPADPALEAVAHQTKDVNVEDQDYDGYIFVLDNNDKSINEFSGAIKTGGDWFTLDEYKNSSNYATYGFADDNNGDPVATQDNPGTPSTDKKYLKDSVVTVTYKVHNINDLGAISSIIKYNSDVLAVNNEAYKDKRGNGVWYEKAEIKPTLVINNTDAGIEIGVTTEDPEFGTDVTAETTFVTVQFKALADFNEEDLGISLETTKLQEITEAGTVDVTNPDDYVFINTTLPEGKPETPVDTNTDNTDTATDTSVKATDSDKKDTNETPNSDSASDTDSSKNNTDSAAAGKGTTSTSTTTTTGTTPTVQTAGTFAVISLVVILMAAAGVVIYTRKKTEE